MGAPGARRISFGVLKILADVTLVRGIKSISGLTTALKSPDRSYTHD
jgi:hypothetical protein